MASSSIRLSYQKLKKTPATREAGGEEEEAVVVRKRWLRLRRRWRRPRVRIVGLRWLLRRKAKLVGAAVRKVVKRLKEGKPYIGELFAGNYMFMQVSPSPTTLGSLDSSFSAAHHHHHHHHHGFIPPISSSFSPSSAVS